MTDRRAVVPSQALPLAIAVPRADALLRIWAVDPETTPVEELRALCLEAAEAMRDGALAGVAAALAAPAPRREIALAVDELISAFPGMRKDADLGVFSKVMAEEIAALAPPSAALQAAIRGLIVGFTFPPSIKEVVGGVAAQRDEWTARVSLLERLPGRILEVSRILAGR